MREQGRLLRQGKRLMVRQAHQPGKGKRNKFNLSPFPNAQCPILLCERLRQRLRSVQVPNAP
ncbi:hypothetical protein VF07_20345 [Nostoc linckia z6]|uniref:Uncharacterized protein n=1 Tax=Nostoc linckia z8 TaxID=1628746 RepID=A0A9Q6EL93_NOSLI|nr:hypothetical protein VF05_16830 [Nostoc linckia z3]PHJ77224.1 hypothetical protein VF03_05065 [Nostoc linckia z2]PHJ87403.1 hypothetical protein VF07_20345 [Nostoc linckia z6]PHK03348.1 hypothetical protein VF08_15345 [Nostoc linckia z8]